MNPGLSSYGVETKPETSSSENKVSFDVSHDPFFESYFKRS